MPRRVAVALVNLDETLEKIAKIVDKGRAMVERDEFLPLAAQQLGVRLSHGAAAEPEEWRRAAGLQAGCPPAFRHADPCVIEAVAALLTPPERGAADRRRAGAASPVIVLLGDSPCRGAGGGVERQAEVTPLGACCFMNPNM